MRLRKLLLPILLGVMLTVILFVLGVPFSKSGAAVFPAIFFPYASMFSFIAQSFPRWMAAGLIYGLLFLQYPVYGAILGNASGDSRFYKRLLLLLALHASSVVVCLLIYKPWNL